ncbi:D-alanyl-D-alanine carboxypeptidase family protein [Brevundimonas subvibrioides]|uniref:D-alanyl-D-alanine carboxypeptidase family protein n=1 Tax=Brevundimonas subvibrioides TaxID=74313 RepID=UPI0022B3F7E3|nr:D-alanyl-D-alanine carboxypeptidase family protein [Brevundimonas subvibrioides]
MHRGLLLPILAILFGLMMAGTGPAMAHTDDRCQAGREQWADQAFANAISEYSLEWSPFGTTEWGWVTYLPLLQKELGTDCDAGTPAFAAALAGFQTRYALTATGVFDQPTFQTLKGVLQERRPFVMARVRDECPDPPPLRDLGYLVESEEHADRLTRLLRRDVLDAYRRMVAAARAEVPEVRNDPELLQIFSGYRDPEADAARCAAERNCDGVRRAVCSPHRTGTAVDLYVGELLGMGVDSTQPASRLHMTRQPTYRWLVRNAGRFGFVPYIFEPWHWEWVGPSTSTGTP